MKILIGSGNYPKLSESYIEAEIQYLVRHGHDVQVWSDKIGSPEAPDIVPVHRGPVAEVIREFRPHIFHAHYLTFDGRVLHEAARQGVPCTIRGHSFDYSAGRARAVADQPHIRRIWLFPHFARESAHPKIVPLPVAYDSALYVPQEEKDKRRVYRTAAGKPGKGLEDFFSIKMVCPGFTFELTANHVHGDDPYLPFLEKTAVSHGIEFAKNILREDAVFRMNRAGIYLDTSDAKGHPFGMPISIAEALATGSYVLARWNPAAQEYLGEAGALYRTLDEAASLIRDTESWSSEKWKAVALAAVTRAQAFSDETVLPEEVAFWKAISAHDQV